MEGAIAVGSGIGKGFADHVLVNAGQSVVKFISYLNTEQNKGSNPKSYSPKPLLQQQTFG
jgi:hypothetical protein